MSDQPERESLLLPILIPVGALLAIVLVLFGFSRVLLSVKPSAATAIALSAAVGTMGVAAFVASRKHVSAATLGAFVGAAAGIAMLAGGLAIAVIGPPEKEAKPFHAFIAAPEGAVTKGYSTDALEFEANAPIELEFKNEEAVGHNVEIFDGPDDSSPVLFDGKPFTGPGTTVYQIKPLPEGEYFFHCRLHPGTAMQGTVTVEKGAGGVRVVAKNTAFDVDTIELPADQPSTLTLDNEDPISHNLSIYENESASGDPLFTFAPFPGPETKTFDVKAIPAGTYYFHCDVHPVMNGTVVVKAKPPGGPGEGGGEGGGAGAPGEPGDGGG
jgi:plastocyanin